MKTTTVIAHTTMEKMQVSRAVASLLDDGLVQRDADPDDRRGQVLRLTPAGQALMKKLVPMVTAREAFLLEALSDAERTAFMASCAKLERRARQLIEQG